MKQKYREIRRRQEEAAIKSINEPYLLKFYRQVKDKIEQKVFRIDSFFSKKIKSRIIKVDVCDSLSKNHQEKWITTRSLLGKTYVYCEIIRKEV
jgi:hypothetical protein